MRKTMLRICYYGLAVACLCALTVTAGTKRVGDVWVLENRALRVEVQAESAQMTVLQKSTGLLWAQEDPLMRTASEEKVKIWRTSTPPTIDGLSKDWVVKDKVWLPWTGDDGEKNLSGGAQLMWDDTHVYLYVRVRDNQRAFGKESTQEWWEADSVEFWIDKVQVGLHLCPGKESAVNAKGEAFAGTKIAVKLIDEGHLPGYAVEVAMPIEHFPILKAPETGVRVYFAIGLNDADPKPGEPVKRVAQGYNPSTWVHSAPCTFAIAVLADQDGKTPPITKKNNRTTSSADGSVANMRKGSGRNALAYSLRLTHGQIKPVDMEVELKLLDNEPAMEVALSCPGGNETPLKKFLYPAPLYPPNPERYFMAMTDYCDGRYVPVGDKSFRNESLNSYGGDMPWVTVTDGKQGMITIAMTPPDSCIQMQSRTTDEERLGFPGFGWFPSKGTFGYARVGRLVFYDKGAHVQACKIYRKIAQEQGLVRTLTTDAKENPDVLKLMGAVDWWGTPGLSFVKEAVAAGMKHGLLNGRFSPASIEEIKKLGWLVGEYDNYEDINDSPTLGRAKAPVKEHALVKADGELMTAWVSRDKDMKPIHTYMKQCTGMMVKNAKAVIPEVLKTYPYNARFLDVTTATLLKECYSPVHGATRSQDLVNRQNLLKYVSRDLGLVTGGEHGRYYDVPYLHYHEGMMGGGMYSWPSGYLRDVKKREDISEQYLNYGINPAQRAPLFELVFHDCVVDYWYWGACSDYLHQVMPELTDRKTAMNVLYGTPPMMWSHSHGLRWQIPEERELMLTIYRNVCKLHEIIGPQEMVSHAFLSDDRMVQQSTFEDGTVATVNFSASPFIVSTKTGGNTLTLLENDFYVHGPKIEQWRVTSSNGAPRQTYIRTDEYLFADSGPSTFKAQGVSSTGQFNLIMESDNRARIVLKAGASLKLIVPEWKPAWKGKRVLVLLNKTGEPKERVPNGDADTLLLHAPADGTAVYLLYTGKEAQIPDVTIEKLELSVDGKTISADSVLSQGAKLTATATLRNQGLESCETDFGGAKSVAEYDVIVYGGTSAGIAAAVQSHRMGCSVVVIEPTRRVGGLTTGGLGRTDIGNKAAIGGLSRQFYRDVRKWYSNPAAWKRHYPETNRDGGQTRTEVGEDTMWTFEPGAALNVFETWICTNSLEVVYGERLDRVSGVSMTGFVPWHVRSIRMESGRIFRGKMFIDATYEGDLMAASKVSYTVGREANAQYGETLNGVQTAHAKYHQFAACVDPYVEKGKPASGLLPFLDPKGPGQEGAGDSRVQAYCYRMCLTDKPENRIPFIKPEGYDPQWYELLLRNFEAGENGMPWINSPMPNRKTDTNNRTGFSTDFIGQNYDYPDDSYTEREKIAARHLLYQQGLMWTLANNPRVPAKIREEVSRWGVCRDEFTEGAGWQEQLYVREARRMVSDLVMTQHHCQGRLQAENPVGLAAYGMDSHNVQRYVDNQGHVRNEGDVEVGEFAPYLIGYRSIIPKKGECANLLVPVCLSASHIAYGSIRMEPVFMVLGQSAATAAALALRDNVAVQDVDTAKLHDRLLADGQILKWIPPSPKSRETKQKRKKE